MARSLITIAVICAVLSGLFHFLLNYEFNRRLLADHQREAQIVQSMWKQSNRQLEELGSLIASLEGISDSISSFQPQLIKKALSRHWQSLQNAWNIDRIAFYRNSDSIMVGWPNNALDEKLKVNIKLWLQKVEKTQQPLNLLRCYDRCSRYLIFPIVQGNRLNGILLITLSAQNWLNQIQVNIGKYSAIIATNSVQVMSGYELKLTSQNQGDNNISHSALKSAIENITTDDSVKSMLRVKTELNTYQLNSYLITPQSSNRLVSIENISDEINQIRLYTLQLAIASFVLFFTGYYFFNQSSRKSKNKKNRRKSDKESVNSLVLPQGISSDIKKQLDQLKQHNKDIRTRLKKEKAALSRERDLVIKILDNVQVIILTLDKDGTISSINLHGELATGYHAADIIGKSFIDLYPENVVFAEEDLKTLAKVAEGQQQRVSHEARLRCRDGSELTILWLHSCLHGNQLSDSPLLAAGLDITEHKQLEKNLSWLADHDSLTSMCNRRRFEDELYDAHDWIMRHQAQGALIYIDLDNFKDINDTSGHQTGDIILRKVATVISELTNGIDAVSHVVTSRLGGDEFAIILRYYDAESATLLARNILKEIYKIRHDQGDIRFQLSCSIGICIFPGMEDNHAELLSNAVFAVYQAKVRGRNQLYLFKDEDSQREQTNERLVWRDRIESAIKEKRFVLYYQPILNIQSRTISHYETLIRMIGDNDEIVSPSVFINMAERLGLINEIDIFVLDSAIAKQAELQRKGMDITLAINLSGKALDNPELAKNIADTIDKHGAKADNLIFEITETAAVSDIVEAEKIISNIQSLGCRFALDDFGVGFSSFYYLRELPVDYVKIDGSFVKDLYNNADNQVLVKALSEVAIGFNKLTIAEFVDSMQTLDILSEAKVKYAQGYFIGKPSQKIPVDPPNFYKESANKNTFTL